VVRVQRGIAFVALLLPLGLADDGARPVTPPASSAIAVHASTIAAPPATDPPAADPPAAQPQPEPVVAVALAPPVRLLIPSLEVDAEVEALGVDSSGAMDTPRNIWNVGWYRNGPSPGAAGDAVIDGHVGLPGSPLVFSGLGRLEVGADVIAVLADGTRSRFSVTGMQSWPASSRPTGLFGGDGAPRLSLITCTGSYDGRSQTYADRLIVEASYVGKD
jgi:hypothetical protein